MECIVDFEGDSEVPSSTREKLLLQQIKMLREQREQLQVHCYTYVGRILCINNFTFINIIIIVIIMGIKNTKKEDNKIRKALKGGSLREREERKKDRRRGRERNSHMTSSTDGGE